MLLGATALGQVSVAPGDTMPPLPDVQGRAGMAAVAVQLPDGRKAVLAAGGANFPDRAPWDGGTKVFHA